MQCILPVHRLIPNPAASSALTLFLRKVPLTALLQGSGVSSCCWKRRMCLQFRDVNHDNVHPNFRPHRWAQFSLLLSVLLSPLAAFSLIRAAMKRTTLSRSDSMLIAGMIVAWTTACCLYILVAYARSLPPADTIVWKIPRPLIAYLVVSSACSPRCPIGQVSPIFSLLGLSSRDLKPDRLLLLLLPVARYLHSHLLVSFILVSRASQRSGLDCLRS